MLKKHKITNGFEAWWFLYYHPKLNVQDRIEIDSNEVDKLKKRGIKVSIDPCGKAYRMQNTIRHALDYNLNIFYAKVNHPTHGYVDKNVSKNKYVEVWLEFGPIYYGYVYSGDKYPMDEWDNMTMLHHSHDPNLDTGAPTFDKALVKLAKLVLKYYGDYTKVAV